MEMDKLNTKKIAIIGMGHMGNALLQGFFSSGLKREQVVISNNSSNNKKIVQQADWIILAVKPEVVRDVLEDIKEYLVDKLLISAAAGVTLSQLTADTHVKQKIVRIMPNLPVACGQGVIGIFANKYVRERAEVVLVFSLLGNVISCEKENELDALTIISGCGPALAAYCINMLMYSGEKFGLRKKVSEKVAFHTFSGTIALMNKTNQSAAELQSAVATKRGVTEEIIKDLTKHDFYKLFVESLMVGYVKIKKIKEDL